MAKQPCGNPCSSCAAKLSCSASQFTKLRAPSVAVVGALTLSATEPKESVDSSADSIHLSGRDLALAYLAEQARAEIQG
jgi:hypothetical protein